MGLCCAWMLGAGAQGQGAGQATGETGRGYEGLGAMAYILLAIMGELIMFCGLVFVSDMVKPI